MCLKSSQYWQCKEKWNYSACPLETHSWPNYTDVICYFGEARCYGNPFCVWVSGMHAFWERWSGRRMLDVGTVQKGRWVNERREILNKWWDVPRLRGWAGKRVQNWAQGEQNFILLLMPHWININFILSWWFPHNC